MLRHLLQRQIHSFLQLFCHLPDPASLVICAERLILIIIANTYVGHASKVFLHVLFNSHNNFFMISFQRWQNQGIFTQDQQLVSGRAGLWTQVVWFWRLLLLTIKNGKMGVILNLFHTTVILHSWNLPMGFSEAMWPPNWILTFFTKIRRTEIFPLTWA